MITKSVKFLLILNLSLSIIACSNTPAYMVDVQNMPAPGDSPAEKRESDGANAEGVSWLWYVLGGLALAMIIGSSGSDEQTIGCFDSEGRFYSC